MNITPEIWRAADGSSVGSAAGKAPESIFPFVETKEGGAEGYLGAYLQEVNLPGYFRILSELYPEMLHAEDIPAIVQEVLSPLFDIQREDGKGIIGVNLFGDKARYIARGSMDDDYWLIARKVLEAGKEWDPDIEILVEGVDVDRVWKTYNDTFGVKEVRADPKFPDRQMVAFPLGNFEVQVSIGKIATVDIRNIVISLVDVKSRRRFFHIDLSELTKNPLQIIEEKRKGETTDWQDLVFATLSQVDQRIFYTMPREVRDVMFRPTAIVTRSTDAEVLLEGVSRAIRMATFHPLEGIKRNGDEIDLVDFRRFAPFFTSDSILKLQRSILQAIGSAEAIPEMNLKLIQNEFKLSFMVDPLWTIASLRDTAIGRLIPGLSHLTPRDWVAIMRSDQFCLELTPAPENRLVPLDQRDKGYLKRQRKIWRTEVDSDGARYSNGLERFLRALSDLGLFHFRSNTVETMFSELWQKLPRRGDLTIGTQDHPLDVPSGYVPWVKAGDLIILYPSNRLPRSAKHIAQDGITITAVATVEKPLKDRLESARQFIAHYAMGTVVEAILNSPDNMGRANSMALIYDMLEQYKFLTPRLLKILYDEEETEFTKSDFTDIVFDLKRLGLIDIYEQDREHPKGDIVTLETYFLDTGPKRPLTEIVNRNDFIDYLRGVNRLYALATVLSLSEFLGIPTIEALLSLREADYDLVKKKIRSRGYRDEVAGELIDYISEFLTIYRSFARETGLFALD